jgi:N-acetylglutamate synthase
VACGRAVLDGDWVGLYSIATAPDVRRQGCGTRITNALLDWAYEQGATNAYLQVHSHNAPALQLYDKLGFSTTYHYWYRSLQ